MSWAGTASENLLPLSIEKQNFPKACKEWSFTNEIVDYETPNAICELCEHENLRYHFKISNTLNNTLWVGSKCIEKFNIAVFDDDGKEIDKDKELFLKKKAQNKHIQNALEMLKTTTREDKIASFSKTELDNYCVAHYNNGKKFNCKILNYLFLRFNEEGIFYNDRFFSITIKSNLDKEMFLKLPLTQFTRIQKALSPTQVTIYKENNLNSLDF